MITRLLHRIGRACGAHPWRTAVAWLVLLGAVTAASALTGGALRDSMDVPGSSSARATSSLRAHFPAETGAEAHVVARWRSAVPAAILAETAGALRDMPDVRAVTTTLSPDGRSAMLVVRYDHELADLDLKASTDALTQAAAPLRDTGATVGIGGQVPEGIQGPNGVAETIGIGVALVILVLAFGSVIAAGLPVLMAGIGIGVGTGLIGLLAAVVDVNTVSPTLGSMLGLGVGIDYALLIIARHRDGLAAGLTPLDAVTEAIGTAGHAVVFAGICVLIGITGLAFSGIPSFASMGVAAGLVVLATATAAITLLPAVLVPLGDRVLSRRTRRGMRAAARSGRHGQSASPARSCGVRSLPSASASSRCSPWPCRPWTCGWARTTPAASRSRTRPGRPTTWSPTDSVPEQTARSPSSSTGPGSPRPHCPHSSAPTQESQPSLLPRCPTTERQRC